MTNFQPEDSATTTMDFKEFGRLALIEKLDASAQLLTDAADRLRRNEKPSAKEFRYLMALLSDGSPGNGTATDKRRARTIKAPGVDEIVWPATDELLRVVPGYPYYFIGDTGARTLVSFMRCKMGAEIPASEANATDPNYPCSLQAEPGAPSCRFSKRELHEITYPEHYTQDAAADSSQGEST